MWDVLTPNKKNRHFDKTLGLYFKADQLNEQIHKKHYESAFFHLYQFKEYLLVVFRVFINLHQA